MKKSYETENCQKSVHFNEMIRSCTKIVLLILFYDMDKEKLKRFLNAFHDKYRTLIGSQVCEELMMKIFYYRLSKTDNFKSLFTEEIGIKNPIFDKIPFDVLFETTKGYISTIEKNSRYLNIQAFRLDYISLF